MKIVESDMESILKEISLRPFEINEKDIEKLIEYLNSLRPLDPPDFLKEKEIENSLENYWKEYRDGFLRLHFEKINKEKSSNLAKEQIVISLKKLCNLLETTDKNLQSVLTKMNYADFGSLIKKTGIESLEYLNDVGIYYAMRNELKIAKLLFGAFLHIHTYLMCLAKNNLILIVYITFAQNLGHCNLGIINLIESKYELAMKRFKFVENFFDEPIDFKNRLDPKSESYKEIRQFEEQVQHLVKGFYFWASILYYFDEYYIDNYSFYNWYKLFEKGIAHFNNHGEPKYKDYLTLTRNIGIQIMDQKLKFIENSMGDFLKTLLLTNRRIKLILISELNTLKKSPTFPILYVLLLSFYKLENSWLNFFKKNNGSLSLSSEKEILHKYNFNNWKIILEKFEKFVERLNEVTSLSINNIEKWQYANRIFKEVVGEYIKNIQAEEIKSDPFSEKRLKHMFEQVLKKRFLQKIEDRYKEPRYKKTKLYFTASYKVEIKPGPERAGLLIINDKEIKISAIESDLCVTMANQLEEDWKYINERDARDVGWVSFKEFEIGVARWVILKKEKGVVPDTVIINAINRLNIKIRKVLGFKEKNKDLIENGEFYGLAKKYRFRVYPKQIKVV